MDVGIQYNKLIKLIVKKGRVETTTLRESGAWWEPIRSIVLKDILELVI